ncbi:MAG: GGDEF domain-containing protein [Acidobacteria bacterium]|nr:GGDEF domain-containing protein [Acidobacteriota bacterium]
MNVPLSLRWMVESYVLLLGMLMLGLGLAAHSMPRLRGVLRLCASVLLIALAMVILFYRNQIPRISFILSDGLIITGFALMDETMTRFLKLRYTERWVDALLFVGTVGFSIYSQIMHLPMRTRTELLVLALALQTTRSGVTLLRRAPSSLQLPARFLAGSFFLFSSFCLVRMVLPILRGQLLNLPADDQAFMVDGASRLSKVVLLCASIAIGYLWMAALQLSNELDALSLTDPLTSVLNRRGLEDRLGRELRRASMNGGRIALISLDVDHFKLINDRYGHPAGDSVLSRFAKALSEMLRPADALGRFGGEEFVAILPNTDEEGARVVAERLRERLRSLRFEFDSQLRLTASFGVTVCERGEDDQVALRRCDQALYAAKQSGRNRVVAFTSLEAQGVSSN